MELKFGNLAQMHHQRTGFNCTFMELKCSYKTQIKHSETCFNCTFMELKFVVTLSLLSGAGVLIVPLWN